MPAYGVTCVDRHTPLRRGSILPFCSTSRPSRARRRSAGTANADSLATPRAQHCGELFRRLIPLRAGSVDASSPIGVFTGGVAATQVGIWPVAAPARPPSECAVIRPEHSVMLQDPFSKRCATREDLNQNA